MPQWVPWKQMECFLFFFVFLFLSFFWNFLFSNIAHNLIIAIIIFLINWLCRHTWVISFSGCLFSSSARDWAIQYGLYLAADRSTDFVYKIIAQHSMAILKFRRRQIYIYIYVSIYIYTLFVYSEFSFGLLKHVP